MTILLGDCHVHARHQREVVSHVALVAFAEIVADILGPLIGLGKKHAILVVLLDNGAHLPDHLVGLGQVFVGGPFTHTQVGDGIQPQTVDPHIEPETHDADYGLHHFRVIVVKVGLVGKKTVPVVGLSLIVPLPVGRLGIGKDNPRLLIFHDRVAPDIELAFARSRWCLASRLKPGVLIGSVVDDQLGDDTDTSVMCLVNELAKITQCPIVGMHIPVIRDIVPVISHGRGVEWQ